ncbi:unnamed protein product [Thelazia callipaeda]|uniref:Uncharacterized protein n=1 Tax=Thelazia callipaeda TaxID=103827 RepID=A0A0N5D9U4_THECL|nr:unnamed protein product [Thelazia callipaeda]
MCDRANVEMCGREMWNVEKRECRKYRIGECVGLVVVKNSYVCIICVLLVSGEATGHLVCIVVTWYNGHLMQILQNISIPDRNRMSRLQMPKCCLTLHCISVNRPATPEYVTDSGVESHADTLAVLIPRSDLLYSSFLLRPREIHKDCRKRCFRAPS